jgi:hypothetical protein
MTNATQHDYAAQARQAIEIVCSGDVSRMEEFYSPDFVDHVNDMTFYGYEGGRESLTFYGSCSRATEWASRSKSPRAIGSPLGGY